jgi:uncharacterized membrane protein
MQGFLRLAQLLSMVVWAGGLIFFAFVLAPTAFHTLPSVHLAGAVVGASLKLFDVIAIVCGFLFLAVTGTMFRAAPMRIRGRYEMEFLLTGVMLLGTAYIHWNIIPAMDADTYKLHVRSERVEGGVMLLSLGVLFLMSREQLAVED